MIDAQRPLTRRELRELALRQQERPQEIRLMPGVGTSVEPVSVDAPEVDMPEVDGALGSAPAPVFQSRAARREAMLKSPTAQVAHEVPEHVPAPALEAPAPQTRRGRRDAAVAAATGVIPVVAPASSLVPVPVRPQAQAPEPSAASLPPSVPLTRRAKREQTLQHTGAQAIVEAPHAAASISPPPQTGAIRALDDTGQLAPVTSVEQWFADGWHDDEEPGGAPSVQPEASAFEAFRELAAQREHSTRPEVKPHRSVSSPEPLIVPEPNVTRTPAKEPNSLAASTVDRGLMVSGSVPTGAIPLVVVPDVFGTDVAAQRVATTPQAGGGAEHVVGQKNAEVADDDWDDDDLDLPEHKHLTLLHYLLLAAIAVVLGLVIWKFGFEDRATALADQLGLAVVNLPEQGLT